MDESELPTGKRIIIDNNDEGLVTITVGVDRSSQLYGMSAQELISTRLSELAFDGYLKGYEYNGMWHFGITYNTKLLVTERYHYEQASMLLDAVRSAEEFLRS